MSSENFENYFQLWGVGVARYVSYKVFINTVYFLGYNFIENKHKLFFKNLSEMRIEFILFIISLAILLYNNIKLFDEQFLFMFMAYLVLKWNRKKKISSINYGVGMACSFFEGYLAQIIPSDGASFVGFEENIRNYENSQGGIVFPVKKLFIVITKSLYCPPDLKEFNKKDQNLPYLEACQSLEDVNKDVAGVKNRIYRNSAYKIHRKGFDPVYLAVECATPLHTLHKVLKNRSVYEELGNINVEEVVIDFSETLEKVIRNSPECRGKCQLVFYDDTDPRQNLANILLSKIESLSKMEL